MTTTKEKQVFMGEFDASRIRIKEPRNVSFGQGKSKITYTISDGVYLDDEGNECSVFFELEPQNCFGINYNFPLQANEKDKEVKEGVVPPKSNGLQVAYPLTSMTTIENQTKNEKYVQNIFDSLWNAAVKHFQEQSTKKDNKLPQTAKGAYLMAKDENNWQLAIKFPYSHTMKDGKNGQKIPDNTKPKRVYIKLVTRGTGRKLQASTPIHGPGDKTLHFTKCINKTGTIHPVIKWDGIYWGAHGRKPYCGSLRFKVAEMNFTPRTQSGVPRTRMLSRNTAPVERESSGEEDTGFTTPHGKNDDETEEGESSGFTKPEEDESNPVNALNNSESEEDSEEESKTKDDKKESVEEEKPKSKMTAARKKALLQKKKELAAKRKNKM